MSIKITANGIQIETFNTIFSRLAEKLKNVYGQDINLEQDTPDGQRIGIFSKEILDLQTYGHYIYTQFDPDTATGYFLNTIIKLNGITRRTSTRSQADILVKTDRPLTLSADYALEDEFKQKWVLISAKALSSGDNHVTFYAEKFGAVEAPANTISKLLLLIEGVIAVTNEHVALVGKDEESDAELRLRRKKTFENAAYSTVGGLNAKLINLPNVSDAIVYENDSDTHDDERDMRPRSVWCVVDGGSVANIIECICKNKTTGVYTKGELDGEFADVITRQDGSTFTVLRRYRFDRPENTDLHVKLTVKRKAIDNPIDISQIKAKIANNQFYINADCDASELYHDLTTIGDNFVAYNLQISSDGETWTDEFLRSGYKARFVIRPENIDITEITTRR